MNEAIIEMANAVLMGCSALFALVLGVRIAGTILLRLMYGSFK